MYPLHRIHYTILSALLSLYVHVDGQKVITASRGDRVVLPCPSPFEYRDNVDFGWKKDAGRVLCRYYIRENSISIQNCESRFAVSPNRTGLIITEVRSSDAGEYKCLMTRVLPPPSEDSSSTIKLQVTVPAGLVLQQMNSSSLSCVDLLCSLEGLSPKRVNFTWTRESEPLLLESSPANMSSTLTLCKPNWTDGDEITCQARHSSNHTLYKQSIKLKHAEKDLVSECPSCCPAIHALQIIFIIVTSLMWTLLCIRSRKTRTNISV